MAKIEITRARKTYPGHVTALRGIDLTVEDGELLVLVGPSGCGKSTLLRMIAGLENVTDGTIAIDGTVVNALEPAERDIAMVFQNYALYPHMSVRGNLEYGLRNRKVPAAERQRLVDEAARILELTPYLDRRPAALSGGQRQRVAMGRAIVRKPRAFLFDEPLSNLDAELRGHMRVEVKRLQRTLGTTAVFVTHDQLEAMTLADRLVVMRDGRIEQIGTPLDIYEQPATTFVARFIGSPGMNILPIEGLRHRETLPAALPRDSAYVGFRPEALRPGRSGEARLQIEGEVEGVEVLGADALVHIRLPSHAEPLIARLATRAATTLSGRTPLEVDHADLHAFSR